MNVSLSTTIHAPVDRVFQLSTDLDRWPEIIKGITRVEKLTPGPVAVGTRFKETRIMFGRETTEEMAFTAIEPNRSYTIEANSCGCLFRATFRFDPKGPDADVKLTMESKATSFFAKLMKPLAYLMAGSMKKCLEGDLASLKASAEKPI